MVSHSELFWFGWTLTGGSVLLVLSLAGRQRGTKAIPLTATDAATIAQLQQQCLRLREELQQQKMQLGTDWQDAVFEQLQTLLTNYPSACKMAQAKPDLPARNLVALFTPLENLLQSWAIEPIGTPWKQVAYDPQHHQADIPAMIAGEPVYIRFVGYRKGDRILCPAKVSRTLPPGVSE